MHLYPLIVAAICLQKVSSADLHQPFAAFDPLDIAAAVTVLQVSLLYTAELIQTIAPTVAGMMPDKAPLIFGASSGCNALAWLVSCGRNYPHPKQVNS